MEFLQEPLAVSLAEDAYGEYTSFSADLFSPRPPFKEIQAFQEWGKELQESIVATVQRKVCPIKWLGIFIDGEGAWLLVAAKKPVQVSNMRSALKPILSKLPAEQLRVIKNTFRPLDEFDRDRISAWNAVCTVRPKTRCPESEDEVEKASFPQPNPLTLAEFLERESKEEDVSADPQVLPQMLMLRDAAREAPEALIGEDSNIALAVWVARAQLMSTIVVAQTGPPPPLSFCRCHREDRRHLMLVQCLQTACLGTHAPLAYLVQEAAAMASEGRIPGPGKHGRNSEFMERCAKAVKAVYPQAETNPNKLSRLDMAIIRRALGGGSAPYEGCLNGDCLDKEPRWTPGRASMLALPGDSTGSTETGGRGERSSYHRRLMSSLERCAYCQMPRGVDKRTWEDSRFGVQGLFARMRDQALEPLNKKRRLISDCDGEET